jgi:hypothetical protein
MCPVCPVCPKSAARRTLKKSVRCVRSVRSSHASSLRLSLGSISPVLEMSVLRPTLRVWILGTRPRMTALGGMRRGPDTEKQCPMCPKSTGATLAVGGVAFSFQRPGREYGTVLRGARSKRVFRRQGFERRGFGCRIRIASGPPLTQRARHDPSRHNECLLGGRSFWSSDLRLVDVRRSFPRTVDRVGGYSCAPGLVRGLRHPDQ